MQGVAGPAGPQGAQGVAGSVGATGSRGAAGPAGAFDGATLVQATSDTNAFIAGVPRWGAYLNGSALQLRISADPVAADVAIQGAPTLAWDTSKDAGGHMAPSGLFLRNVVTSSTTNKHWYVGQGSAPDAFPAYLEMDFSAVVYLSGCSLLSWFNGGGYTYFPGTISLQARALPTDAWTTVTSWSTHKAAGATGQGAIGWRESLNYSNITYAGHANPFTVTGRRYWRINFVSRTPADPDGGFTLSNVVMWGFR